MAPPSMNFVTLSRPRIIPQQKGGPDVRTAQYVLSLDPGLRRDDRYAVT
jgi:hypothetical protein